MMNTKSCLLCISFLWLIGCQTTPSEINPSAPSFDLAGSDAQAIAIADEVMEASGGRNHWDNARWFSWVFAGARQHYWDKQTGDIRIESKRDSMVYLLNLNSMKGEVWQKEVQVTDPEELANGLKKAKSIWNNDAYWLLMPFKLKDDGVTLKYLGTSQTLDSLDADVLSLTFKEVGDTPNNKYHVMVDKETRLVTEWSFFREAKQDSATFTLPWSNYQQYGNLKLSGDHDRLQLTNITVDQSFPEGILKRINY